MPDAPMPLKVVLGLAAAAVEEARKLPETLPVAVSKAPVLAVTTAMAASMRLQQRLTELANRGDELLSQLRGTSEQPPSWATFDGPPAEPAERSAPRAAFDLIDYEDADDDTESAEPAPPLTELRDAAGPAAAKKSPAKAVKQSPAKAVKNAPAKAVKKAPAKKALKVPPVADSPAEVAAKMAAIASVPPPAKKAPAKAGPAPSAARPGGPDLANDAALEDSSEA